MENLIEKNQVEQLVTRFKRNLSDTNHEEVAFDNSIEEIISQSE